MAAIRQITDIVAALIAQLEFTIEITANVDNLNGNHVLSMDNTYYLTKLKTVEIGGFNYTVDSFVFNESITVSPIGHSETIMVVEFVLPAPLFFFGTVKSTDEELKETMEVTPDAYPVVYLYEIIKEKMFVDATFDLERESPIQLFFLDIANYEDNINKDFVEDVLKPLSNLEARFFELLKKEKGIGKLRHDYDRINLARFARTTREGEEKLIFSEELSGLEIDIILPIKKC